MKIENNQDRAESAYRAVSQFSFITGLDGEEMETKISDLLCNLKHLADEQGVSFQECLDRALRHYYFEINEEKGVEK